MSTVTESGARALKTMAVLVNLLTKDELVFECRIRGFSPTSVNTVAELRDQLSSLLTREGNGEELECSYEFELDEEILICGSKVERIAHMIESLSGDLEEVPEKIPAAMNHVSARLGYHLSNCEKGIERDRLKRLAISVVEFREVLAGRVAKARDILKKIPTFSEVSCAMSVANGEEIVGKGRSTERRNKDRDVPSSNVRAQNSDEGEPSTQVGGSAAHLGTFSLAQERLQRTRLLKRELGVLEEMVNSLKSQLEEVATGDVIRHDRAR